MHGSFVQDCVSASLTHFAQLLVGSEKARRLLDQIEKDCLFLKTERLLDYSLLVGIGSAQDESSKSRPVRATLCGGVF